MASVSFLVLLTLLQFLVRGIAKVQKPIEFKLSMSKEPHEYGRVCPLQECSMWSDVQELLAPGIGFALETSHGTAVAKLDNGTLHHITSIEGDQAYRTLMRQRTTAPLRWEPPTYDSIWEKLQYLKSRAQRLANKFAGRPATSQTGILALMVSELINSTQNMIGDGFVVVAAALSSPDLARFTSEEIGDIFDYLNIQDLTNKPRSPYPLSATSAAYGAYGKGLCNTYTDSCVCKREERELPDQCVLHVDLDLHALSGTVKGLRTVYGGSFFSSFMNPDLGYKRKENLSARSINTEDDNEKYWAAVSAEIRNLIEEFNRDWVPEITDFMVTGPFAWDQHFGNALEAALGDLIDQGNVLTIPNNLIDGTKDEGERNAFFTFATARGAAEIAKRRQECIQTDTCSCRSERVQREQQPMIGDRLRSVLWWLKSLL